MRAPLEFIRRLRALFRKEKLDRDMAEEMRFHLAQRAADHVDNGMPADEARYAALRKFGNAGVIQERVREQRGLPFVEDLVADVRFAGRTLRKHPGFTAVAI